MIEEKSLMCLFLPKTNPFYLDLTGNTGLYKSQKLEI